MHLRKADERPDLGLGEVLVKAQAHDLTLARGQGGGQRSERLAILHTGKAIVYRAQTLF